MCKIKNMVMVAAMASMTAMTVPALAGSPQGGLLPQPTPSSGLLQSGLLDFSRFDVKHSLNYGVASGSAGTQSGGLWLTEVGYRISDPLRISVDVGAALNTDGGPVLSENSFFLHSLNLDYQPSKNFSLHVSYVNLPQNTSLFSHQGMLGRRPGLWDSPLGLPR